MPRTAEPAGANNVCASAFETMLRLRSYHSTFTTADHVVTTLDIELPDRAHYIGQGTEMITIGSRAWLRTAGAAWQSRPASATLKAGLAKRRQKLEEHKNDASCVVSGTGTYQGRPARILTFSNNGPNGAVPGKAYLLGDGYIHRIENGGPSPNALDFSNFNSVSIERP
jgi:hypothetical protein